MRRTPVPYRSKKGLPTNQIHVCLNPVHTGNTQNSVIKDLAGYIYHHSYITVEVFLQDFRFEIRRHFMC